MPSVAVTMTGAGRAVGGGGLVVQDAVGLEPESCAAGDLEEGLVGAAGDGEGDAGVALRRRRWRRG